MRSKDAIVSEPRISRLLDTLCLEVSYTRPDSNSQGLLQILGWRLTDTINESQLSELYKEWLSSKGVFDITKSRQTESLNKMELLEMVSVINFQKEREIIKAIRLLRKEYNIAFSTLYREKVKLIEAIDNLFDMVDREESFHLRKPQILVLFQALLISKIYALKPATIDNYWRVYGSFQKQINMVDNKLSIRAFKNYILANVSNEQMELIGKSLDANKYEMNFYEDGIKVWRRYQKELSGKNWLVCRRVFSDNEHLFVGQKQNPEEAFTELAITYGAGFLALHNIDAKIVQQFSKVMDGVLKKHINEVLKFIDKQESQASSLNTNTSKAKTIKMKNSVSAKKSMLKRQSMRTPTKSSQSFFTPRKQSTKAKMVSPLSKTRQSIDPPSPRDTNSILQCLSIFKNQRIQSFQSVMRRLKKR